MVIAWLISGVIVLSDTIVYIELVSTLIDSIDSC
jgi:hypothetical protein